ncbi:MAG TPA: MFS transporter [Polyangiaceae bacterium]|jgi:MFS family permease
MSALPPGTRFESDIPARLDRLPWSRWHWRVVIALGVTWMLDGLEVTLVGAVAPLLAEKGALRLSEAEIGASASIYLAGAITGALVFGRLSDLFGRRRLFFVTLALYACATAATALSWSFASFAVCRALTGAGIGGEGSAVNSAIDELLPARVRGHADLAINGTYWLGTALGAALTLVVADPRVLPHALAWRVAFLLGAVLATPIFLLRNHLPESPRWLLLHGRVADAEQVTRGIERHVEQMHGTLPPPGGAQTLHAKGSVTFRAIARVLIRQHPRRTVLGLSLMIAQAFAYNGVFFTYALVLSRFYDVAPARIGLYLIPFAVGNLLGPLVLGRLFDSVGRRPMIAATYFVAALLIALAGWGMAHGWLSAATQTLLWSLAFFVASAAASSAYLTVSELFPVELRGMAIALFYAVGTAAGGLAAPAIFGALVQTGERGQVFDAYLVAAGLMAGGAVVAAMLGVPAERKSLEELTGA